MPQLSPGFSRRIFAFSLLLLLALVPAALLASDVGGALELELDAEQTQISFTVGATGHDVEGMLFLSSGALTFDPDSGTASGTLVIDAQRAETGNSKRDQKMHKTVLESVLHPEISFTATSIEGKVARSGASEFGVVGTLNLLGNDHPFTLPIRAEFSGDQVKATSTFSVPYVEWGLHNPSLLVLRVAKEVIVTVTTQGAVSRASAPLVTESR
jgi:polyisoprenoid-binding protein YceI